MYNKLLFQKDKNTIRTLFPHFSGCVGLTVRSHIQGLIFFLGLVISFSGCDDDSIFRSKVTTSNGITTVSGIRPGGLERALFLQLGSITHLVINDTIDSRDFNTMRNKMSKLSVLDLSNAVIAAYDGFEGSAGTRVYYYPANVVPDFAFYNPETSLGKSSLKSILLPHSIRSIGNFAFNRCDGLSGTLTLPASVRDTIGRSAFSFCNRLSGVKLSAVSYIGESAFQNCSNLTDSLIIPDSVFSIRPWAFAFCNKIKNIRISSTVSDIQATAFAACSGLFSVDTANPGYSSSAGVLFNGDKSFLLQFPTSKTGSYEVPSTVADIGMYAFAYCTGLTSIKIPATTNVIEDYAFSGCTGLTGAFPISSGIFAIGVNVFDNCPNISSFDIAADNTSYSYTAGILSDLVSMSIKRCTLSKTGSYIIPDNFMIIDNSAFSNCSKLTSIVIPESIYAIGSRAFYNCTGLTRIYVKATTPVDLSYSGSVFDGVDLKHCTLYVPSGTKANYQNASGWKDFRNIVEN